MSKQHQVVIKFTGNTTQAEAAMRKLKTEMSAVGAEITKVDNTVKKTAHGFTNVSQVAIKSTASLTDLKHAIRGASTGIIDAGATLDQYKIKTTDLRTHTISAAEAAKKAAVEQARYNKLMNQGAIDAQRLAAATARAATAASATANANALAAIRQNNASTVGVGTAARANAAVANADLSTQAAALRLQSQQAAAAAASAAHLQRQQDMQAASAARAAQHASALAIAQSRQQAAADRAALAAKRLADANNYAGRSSQDAGGMHGLSAKHVLTYSAAYMAAATAITGFLAAVASVPQLGMKLQATESGLLGVYKNQALVNEQLGFLSRLADEAGVKVTTLRDAYTKFTASAIKAGTTVEDAQKQFENYTKTARALNLSDQDFQGMLTAIQQILSKGRIMSEELQGQLGEHIPAAVAIMAKSIKNADGTIGVTTMELRKMMEQGQLTSLEMQRFSDILFKEFSQGYAASVNNLSAETARFGNAWDEVAVTVFKATEGIMADVVKLSTGALHQLNETLQTTTDYITDINGKRIKFSVEAVYEADDSFIERLYKKVGHGLENLYELGVKPAFAPKLELFARGFEKLGDFVFQTSDEFRDYQKVVNNVVAANTALGGGFDKLRKLSELGEDGVDRLKIGHEKYAMVLRDELAVALRNYNQQAAEMLRQIETQEETVANLNKSGQSSTGEAARLAESKKSYEALMEVITNYADLFVRTNQKIGNASNEAKAALNAEAKVAADGVRAAEAEAAADKAAKEAKKAHRKETEIKVEVDRKHADALRKSVEAQLEANLALKSGSAAVDYYKLRLEGLTAAEAKAAVGKQAQVKAEEELKKLRGEQTTSSENILEKYKVELENSGILFTDNFTEAESAAQRAIGYAETFEAKLKAAGEAFKNVTSEVTQYAPSSSGYKGSYTLTAPNTTINKTVAATAKRYGVDPAFAMAIAQQETGYLKTQNRRENAVSPVGALGVMQVMPGTGAQMGYSTKDLTNLTTNIEAGVRYLAQMLKQFNGSETLAAAAYNAGPNRQALKEGRVPNIKETQEYVKAVAKYTADFRGQSDKAAASWDEVTEAVGETTSRAKDTVTVTGEYSGKLEAANLSQEELWRQLSSQKLQNAANDLSAEADKQRRSYELSGLALREQELTAQGITGQLQAQVIASEQKRDFAQAEAALRKDWEALKYSGAADTYRASLSDTTLSKAQIENLTGQKLEILFEEKMRKLDERAEKALLVTDAGLVGKAQKVSGDIEEAYAKSKLAVEGFSEAQVKAYNAWATEVEALEEAAKKVEDYEKAVTDANRAISESFAKDLEESLASGKLNFQSFADTVIAEITRLQVIRPLMESLFGQDGSGKGGLFGGSGGGIVQTIGSFLGFANGGAFNYNGLQEYANGGAFHNSVLHKPTQFFANGGLAVAGEAGAEAVMPLTRINGRLGVQSTGAGVVVQPQIKINVVNNAGAEIETRQQTDSDGNINMTVMISQIEGAISDRARRGQGLANVFKRVG